jgi:hypothetical protein
LQLHSYWSSTKLFGYDGWDYNFLEGKSNASFDDGGKSVPKYVRAIRKL